MATSRKRRKRRKPQARPPAAQASAPAEPRGYERSRARDEAARAALRPLRPGERPTAVTVGAIAASGLALANLIAAVLGYSPGQDSASPGSKLAGTLAATALLVVVAYGMWRTRYWAVLGMQTLLGLTIVASALALLTAVNVWAVILVTLILLSSGTLFWFLIKAMARIQMPERPGSQRTG
jgi:cation transport ATPase